jgi:hypothetical protein
MHHRLAVVPAIFLSLTLMTAAQTPGAAPSAAPAKPAAAARAARALAQHTAPEVKMEASASLPVRRVVLYKSGVGFFQHLGRVSGNQEVGIQFTTGQLNDVLKSLTAIDLNGGTVSGIRYNSIAPLAQRLSTLPVRLSDGASREELLKAARGARVEIKSGAASFTGRLFSVESIDKKLPGDSNETIAVTQLGVLGESGELRSFELGAGLSVKFLDAELNRDFTRYLALISSSRAPDLRQMTLSALGAGERNLLVSYISEVPVWKSTYRLLIPSKAGEKPLLQGWAIVDNTVGEDWKDVELSLVAGEPQSFVQNLSQPLYTRRPEIALPESAQLTPQTHEETVEAEGSGSGNGNGAGLGPSAQPVAAPQAKLSSGDRASALNSNDIKNLSLVGRDVSELVKVLPGFSNDSVGNGYSAAGAPKRQTINADMVAEVKVSTSAFAADSALGPVVVEAIGNTESDATGSKMGDYFEYALKQRITVLQNQSALVPIVSARVEADKVTLWNPGEGVPLRALWLKNTSGLTLDGGTFNILDGDAFAGEGIFTEMKPDERRLLSYAADTAVRVKTTGSGEVKPVTRVRIAEGTITLTREERSHNSFDIHNADTTPRSVVVEYPARPGWKFLPESATPEETTQNLYRFRLHVEAGKNAELKVEQYHPIDVTYTFLNISDDTLVLIAKQRERSPELDKAIKDVAAKNMEIKAIADKLQANKNEVDDIGEEQDRLRDNLEALKESSEEKALRQRYVAKLSQQEDRLAAIEAENKQLQEQQTKMIAARAAYIHGLVFDVSL